MLQATIIDHHTFTVDHRYNFAESRILGSGTNGVVAKAFDKVRNIDVAIKRVRPYSADKSYSKLVLREIRCLKLLNSHPNVRFIVN
jgi:serine/threonine protein kinase